MSVNPVPSQNEYKPFLHKVEAFVTDPVVSSVAFAILCVGITAVFAPISATIITGGIIAVIGATILLGYYVSSRVEDREEADTATQVEQTQAKQSEESLGTEDNVEPVENKAHFEKDDNPLRRDSTSIYSGGGEFSRSSSPTSSETSFHEARERFSNDSSEESFHSANEEFEPPATRRMAEEFQGTDSSSEASDDENLNISSERMDELIEKFAEVKKHKKFILPPVNVPYKINVGIENIRKDGKFGNSCWLNSTLNFIAATNYYDSMLTGDETELRIALRRVVEALRSSQGGTLDRNLYLDLQDKIASQMPKFAINGEQRDAQEFLATLVEKLSWSPAYKVNMVQYSIDTAEQNELKDDTGILTVQVPQGGEFDLADVLFQEQTRETNSVGGIQKETIKNVITALPEHLMIHLNTASENLTPEYMPRLFTRNGAIVLYESYFNEDGLPVVSKKATYTIESSIMHHGSARSGHYTCYLRNGKSLELHNDAVIHKDVQPEEFGVSGCFIHLRKVDEEIIASPS